MNHVKELLRSLRVRWELRVLGFRVEAFGGSLRDPLGFLYRFNQR